jgi:hypothetical protein
VINAIITTIIKYRFVKMLLIFFSHRDIEYGNLFANNHSIFKMLRKLKVMTEVCKITINYNVVQ